MAELRSLASIPATLIFFESPGRLAATLAAMEQMLGNRQAAVARELTKKFEEVKRGNAWPNCRPGHWPEKTIRGEFVDALSGRRSESMASRRR